MYILIYFLSRGSPLICHNIFSSYFFKHFKLSCSGKIFVLFGSNDLWLHVKTTLSLSRLFKQTSFFSIIPRMLSFWEQFLHLTGSQICEGQFLPSVMLLACQLLGLGPVSMATIAKQMFSFCIVMRTIIILITIHPENLLLSPW